MEKMLKNLFTDKKIEYFETVNNFCDIGTTLQNSQNLRKNCKFRRKSLRDKRSTQIYQKHRI